MLVMCSIGQYLDVQDGPSFGGIGGRPNFFWCRAPIKAPTANTAIEEYWISSSHLRSSRVW